MAEVYWLSFRIHNDSGYDAVYEDLREAIGSFADKTTWWSETTSFYIFESDYSIGDIASGIKRSIRTDRDLVVIGMTNVKAGRVIGSVVDEDILSLIPFMRKV